MKDEYFGEIWSYMCVKWIFEVHQPSFSFVERGGQVKKAKENIGQAKQGTKEQKGKFLMAVR